METTCTAYVASQDDTNLVSLESVDFRFNGTFLPNFDLGFIHCGTPALGLLPGSALADDVVASMLLATATVGALVRHSVEQTILFGLSSSIRRTLVLYSASYLHVETRHAGYGLPHLRDMMQILDRTHVLLFVTVRVYNTIQ